MIIRALDLITIVVPPALRRGHDGGHRTRLRKAKIFCISPNQIKRVRHPNAVCFDKTGTLTEDGLDLWGVLPTEGDTFAQPNRGVPIVSSPPAKPCRSRGRQHPQVHQPDSLASSPFLEAMATCHTLTRIEGELSGDPLDLKMFLSTGWQLEEPERDDHKKFDQLVSTIVRQPAGQTQPEESQRDAVRDRHCAAVHLQLQPPAHVRHRPAPGRGPFSPPTAPGDGAVPVPARDHPGSFHDCLMLYTPARATGRSGWESVERELIFLGLLVMENRLKPQTTRVIHELLNANIRPVMVTGDNILTALSVARLRHHRRPGLVILVQGTPGGAPFKAQCARWWPEHAFSMLNARDPEIDIREGNYHLAMTGRSWEIVRANFPHLIPKLVVKGTVFRQILAGSEGSAGGGSAAVPCSSCRRAHRGKSWFYPFPPDVMFRRANKAANENTNALFLGVAMNMTHQDLLKFVNEDADPGAQSWSLGPAAPTGKPGDGHFSDDEETKDEAIRPLPAGAGARAMEAAVAVPGLPATPAHAGLA
uniref:Cation_ATPase_C domain-containing protein n=1 Tax=Macrostomum lignano TaxID=282301 RepID=A0A1I8FKN0_9PLAT